MLVIEFWRSRLFPSDLAYMRKAIYNDVPDAYTIPELARILADLHAKYGTPQRQVRHRNGRIVRISFAARARVGAKWRNYAASKEERYAL